MRAGSRLAQSQVSNHDSVLSVQDTVAKFYRHVLEKAKVGDGWGPRKGAGRWG